MVAEKNHIELFDLEKDLSETRELAAQHPKVVCELTDKYNPWLDEMADPVSKQVKRWHPDSCSPARKMSKEKKESSVGKKTARTKAREAKRSRQTPESSNEFTLWKTRSNPHDVIQTSQNENLPLIFDLLLLGCGRNSRSRRATEHHHVSDRRSKRIEHRRVRGRYLHSESRPHGGGRNEVHSRLRQQLGLYSFSIQLSDGSVRWQLA